MRSEVTGMTAVSGTLGARLSSEVGRRPAIALPRSQPSFHVGSRFASNQILISLVWDEFFEAQLQASSFNW